MFKGETEVDVNVVNENVAQDINVSTKKCKEVLGKRILYRMIKRSVDIIGAILGILILIPLTIGIAIAKLILKEKSTIFYTHNRIGRIVRKAIEEAGGTMPEDLPTPKKSLKQLEKENKKSLLKQ